MNRTLEWVRLLTIVGLLAASGFQLMTIHNQQKLIDLQMQTIETWRARAMKCEGIVLTDDH
jgi:outer membrane lipopolysaccharide assembly protein LptE/RlpB